MPLRELSGTVEPAIGARRIALFTSLYAGALAGCLALLGIFLLGWDVVAYALGADPRDGLSQASSSTAFGFLDVLAVLGGILGSYWAVHYDFSRGTQTLPKAVLVGFNLLAIPAAIVAANSGDRVEGWFIFLVGVVVGAMNLLTLLFSQYYMGERILMSGLRNGALFAVTAVTGAWLERIALLPGGSLWTRLAGHVLLLAAAVFAAFYALLLVQEVWEASAEEIEAKALA